MKKLKPILCISLIVAVLAAAVALVLNIINTPYGNTVSFYISKRDSSKKLLPFLTSEIFAERLLLDEYGLPAEFANDPKYKDAYEEAKQAIITHNEAREKLEFLAEKNSRLTISLTTPKDPVTGEVITNMEEIGTRYTRLKNAYDDIYERLSTYLSVRAEEMVTEEHKLQIQKLEAQLAEAEKERDAFKFSAYYPALQEQQDLINEYSHCANLVRDTRVVANELRDALLEDWRENEEIQEQVAMIISSLYFSYEIPGKNDLLENEYNNEEETDEPSYADKPADSYYFLKVYVVCEGDEEYANFIIDRIKSVLPDYIEQTIEQYDHLESVECSLISPFSKAIALDLANMLTSTALVTIVAFIVSAVLVCLFVVGKDWFSVSIKPKFVNLENCGDSNNNDKNNK